MRGLKPGPRCPCGDRVGERSAWCRIGRGRTASPQTPPAHGAHGVPRLGLFLPYILLALVAIGWSAGWFWIRARAASEIDGWIAREAAAGRTWTCADRSLGGYPFRIELRCSAVTLERADGRFRLGPSTAVAQVYQPRLVVFESAGPFHVEQGDLIGDASWKGLQGSFHGAAEGFTRASLVVDNPERHRDGRRARSDRGRRPAPRAACPTDARPLRDPTARST